MRSKFISLYLGSYFDMPKSKSSWKIAVQILVVLSLTFVADTKIIFGYKFVAPLTTSKKCNWIGRNYHRVTEYVIAIQGVKRRLRKFLKNSKTL